MNGAPDARGAAAGRALVIGVGNEYGSDDAVGRLIARKIRALLGGAAPVREESGEGAALMQAWAGADLVILCDAVSAGAEPGAIYRIDAASEPIPAGLYRFSTHAFGVAQAVELARSLGDLPRRLIIYGVTGRNWAAGQELTPAVAAAVDEVARRAVVDLQQYATEAREADDA